MLADMHKIILEPPVQPMLHQALDEGLNIDAAAALLQTWTDKQRGVQRQWEHLEDADKQLYRLLVYSVALALVEET